MMSDVYKSYHVRYSHESLDDEIWVLAWFAELPGCMVQERTEAEAYQELMELAPEYIDGLPDLPAPFPESFSIGATTSTLMVCDSDHDADFRRWIKGC